MKKIRLYTLVMSVLSLLFCPNLNAQVTIGNPEAPATGALLQLKEATGVAGGNSNASKGLGLPRVNLTNLNNLYPMFVSGAADYLGPNKTTQDEKHIGLVVYNSNYCLKNAQGIVMGKGLFVWDGTTWQAINGLDVEYAKLPTATPAETSAGSSTWGKKVFATKPSPMQVY